MSDGHVPVLGPSISEASVVMLECGPLSSQVAVVVLRLPRGLGIHTLNLVQLRLEHVDEEVAAGKVTNEVEDHLNPEVL